MPQDGIIKIIGRETANKSCAIEHAPPNSGSA